MKNIGLIIVMSIFCFFLLNGCNLDSEKEQTSLTSNEKETEIIIFAASSLNPLLTELRQEFQDDYPNIEITINASSTQTLKTQIEQGAKADLFMAARERDVKNLQEKGFITSYQKFAGNHLEIVTSNEGQEKIKNVADLTDAGIRIILGDETIPVGEYSLKLLKNIETSKQYSEDLVGKIENNVVSYENTEQSVVGKILNGEADAAIVFRSSYKTAKADGKAIAAVPFDEKFNVDSFYYLAELKEANEDKKIFIEWLESEKAQRIIEKFGLETL